MRIAIDARMTFGAMHGIARYTISLVQALVQVAPEHEYLLLVDDMAAPDHWASALNIDCVPVRGSFVSVSGQVAIARAVRRIRPDLFHAPSFMVPWVPSVPTVATIHDLIHLQYANDYSLKHRLYFRYFLRTVARRLPHIITISEYSKQQIVSAFGLPPDRITVTPLAAPPGWAPESDPAAIAATLQRLDLEPGFIFCVGNPKPHKNLHGLMSAYADSELTHPLVILARPNEKLLGWTTGFGIHDRVRFVTGITDDALRCLYSSAAVLAIPSLCEGFGLMALEALGCDCPVVSSNRSALPEVVGDAGLLVDPTDPTALGNALKRVIGDDALRTELIAKGRQRFEQFSWETVARQTVAVYESVRPVRTK